MPISPSISAVAMLKVAGSSTPENSWLINVSPIDIETFSKSGVEDRGAGLDRDDHVGLAAASGEADGESKERVRAHVRIPRWFPSVEGPTSAHITIGTR